ncbi:MAG TPA: lactonase family protein [Thermomicrobiales bacterium]|nr:lactonase family protein [Thermomicrobiales bacterium]
MSSSNQPQFVYVGAYTSPQGRAEGISSFRFDAATGALTDGRLVAATSNPSFQAFDAAERYLFTVDEINEGGVSAYARDAATGDLTLLNSQPTGGAAPCHLSVDPTGRYLLSANYTSGSLAVHPIGPDGRLGAATDVVQHTGSSVNPQRQAGPHAHMITSDPAGRYILAADLGLDKVLVYQLDRSAGKLAPQVGYGQANPGAGPRQIAFQAGANYVSVLNEIDSTVTTYAYDQQRGTLDPVQTISTLPAGFTGDTTCARIEVHANGKFLYASNRGHDSIAIFAIDAATGYLTAAGHVSTQGHTPRHFAIDPTGAWLLAANQGSDNIVVFSVNPETGQLTPTGRVVQSPSPVCLIFSRA